MARIALVVVTALLVGCDVEATDFSEGQFRFVPPEHFEEPYWNPKAKPNVKVYFHGEVPDVAMLSVSWFQLSIDTPLSPAEEPAANDTCAQAGLEGLLRGDNEFAERNQIQSHTPVQRVDVSGVPAALIEYKAVRGQVEQRGFVACIARQQEALLVTFQEPVTGSDLLPASEAFRNTLVQ